QQPVEADTMGDAARAAFELHNEEKHLTTLRRARSWFHGHNTARQPLADVRRGACCDGLQPAGVNRNQGAESTLAFLWTELRNHEMQRVLRDHGNAAVASA